MPTFSPGCTRLADGSDLLKLRLHHFDLPLRHVFTISRESISVQPTLIVELSDGEHRGFGEATANAYYGATVERIQQLSIESPGVLTYLPEEWTIGHNIEARPEDESIALSRAFEAN